MPCRVFNNKLQTIEPGLNIKGITVIKLDADNNRLPLESLQIKSLPAYFLYNEGRLLWSDAGTVNMDEIKETILQKTQKEN